MSQKFDATVCLTLVRLKAYGQFAKCRQYLGMTGRGGVRGQRKGSIAFEQQSEAEEKRSTEQAGAHRCKDRSRPTAINHHRTLRVPVSMEKYWEKLRPPHTQRLPGSWPCAPRT